jgi:hypothetical protein
MPILISYARAIAGLLTKRYCPLGGTAYLAWSLEQFATQISLLEEFV